jgi:hypothetical protein
MMRKPLVLSNNFIVADIFLGKSFVVLGLGVNALLKMLDKVF